MDLPNIKWSNLFATSFFQGNEDREMKKLQSGLHSFMKNLHSGLHPFMAKEGVVPNMKF
jgi:hypothetical protein